MRRNPGEKKKKKKKKKKKAATAKFSSPLAPRTWTPPRRGPQGSPGAAASTAARSRRASATRRGPRSPASGRRGGACSVFLVELRLRDERN